jgi:glutathione synthase/RimK-type ligase-like ATP-grasp enzyme
VQRRRIALATYEHAPGLAPDDRLLIPALESCGLVPVPTVWSDANAPWDSFDAVVIRSCWDYHLRAAEFAAWLARLESARVPVFNSPAIVRWNADKRYLLDLVRHGVATIPTMIVEQGGPDEIARVAAAEAWTRIVVKPAVSASGYETYAMSLPFDDGAVASLRRATAVGHVLVQPFAEEVPRDGEYSFTFIDGAFSHATIKRATAGEFRVQTEHGGRVDRIKASESLTSQAARALRVLPEVPLYARVDGIARADAFLLMELELIEPNLFLEYQDGSADRMARAIAARLP